MPADDPARNNVPKVRWVLQRAETIRCLALLTQQGFISGWCEEAGWWWVDFPGADRWYSRAQIGAFIDGASAMGAAI